MAGEIFISYRRSDSRDVAGRIADHMQQTFGRRAVFFDTESIPPGASFPDALRGTVAKASAVLVVIGPTWVSERLHQPDDWVAREVREGLAIADRPVVPILVGGAELPLPSEIPVSLHPLLARNAIRIDHAEFEQDVTQLAESLERDTGLEPTADRHRLRVVGAGALVAFVALGLFFATRPTPPPTELTGEWRVAIAGFTSSDVDGDRVKSLIDELVLDARSVIQSTGLESENVTVAGPADNRELNEAVVRTDAEAAQLADRIKADVLVYGTIDERPGGSIATISFYLDDRLLVGGTEIAGNHQLGSPVETNRPFSTNAAARRTLRNVMGTRIDAVLRFLVALSYYGEGDAERASDHLDLLVANETLGGPGSESIQLLAGNARLKIDPADTDAETLFRSALAANPDYARAKLALGTLSLYRSGRCVEGGLDAQQLSEAETWLDETATVGVDLETAASRGLLQARIELCRLVAGLDGDLTAASAAVDSVIDSYKPETQQRLQAYASEAYGLRGFLEGYEAREQGTTLGPAIVAFETAADLAVDDQRRAVLLAQLARTQCRAGRFDDGRASHDAALEAFPELGIDAPADCDAA